MDPLGPDPKLARSLAELAGCHVEGQVELADGGHAYEVHCPRHAAKVALLGLLMEHDARLPDVRRLAELVVAGAQGPEEQAAALQRWVQSRVTFTGEPTETFSPTVHTLAVGLGDCDDSARALGALARAIGLPVRLRTLPDDDEPTHVAAQVQLGGVWRWLEASIPAALGEHPTAAAKRLGIRMRPELAQLGQPAEPLRLTGRQQAAIVVGAGAVLAMALVPHHALAAAAGICGGVVLGYQLTAPPLLNELQAGGYTCRSDDGEQPAEQLEACERAYQRIRLRNTALAAVAGALLGEAIWRLRGAR